MRFTMFNPRGTATATLEEPPEARPAEQAWKNQFTYGYEEIEAPWSFRYSQIGVGISTYVFVWGWCKRILIVLFLIAFSDVPPQRAALALALTLLVVNSLAALGGGMVAGFWARNWVPQGLGVAAGVLFIPLLIRIVFPPESWAAFAVMLGFTTVLALLGAFLGHLLVKPTRIPKS
jgi:hypothetical protein